MSVTDDAVLINPSSGDPVGPLDQPDTEDLWAHLPDGTRMVNVAGVVRGRAAATPDVTAISEPSRDTTFAELDARSSQVAQALLAEGVQTGDRVVYLGINAPAFLEVIYGAAKIGAVPTPLNNRLALAELTAVLADAEPAVVITGTGEPDLADIVPPRTRRVVDADGYADWIAAQPGRRPRASSRSPRIRRSSSTPRAPPACPRASCCPAGRSVRPWQCCKPMSSWTPRR